MTDLFYGHFKDIPIVKVLKTRKVFSDSNFSRSILQPNVKKPASAFHQLKTLTKHIFKQLTEVAV